MQKDVLVGLIRKEFPDLHFEKVDLITKGWDHDTLVLDDKYIFRFLKEPGEFSVSFSREVSFLADFVRISYLPVPDYKWISSDKSFGGYEMIHGDELTQEMYQNISQDGKSTFIEAIAKFMSILHKVTLEKARGYGFEPYSSWSAESAERQRWYEQEFKELIAPSLTAEQQSFVERFAAAFYYSDYSFQPVLAHYDLSHDHILMLGEKVSGVIDFGDLRIGDPAQEFAGFFDYDLSLPAAIVALYEGLKDTEFLKRAYQHYVQRWIYLHYDALVRRKDNALWDKAQVRLNKIIKDAGVLIT